MIQLLSGFSFGGDANVLELVKVVVAQQSWKGGVLPPCPCSYVICMHWPIISHLVTCTEFLELFLAFFG